MEEYVKKRGIRMYEEEEVVIEKTKEATDRKCPQCDGTMTFDPKTGALKCPFCDYVEEIPQEEDVPTEAEELDFFQAEETGNCNWGVETKTVICKMCAGESVYDALQIAGVCPYCGSNQVLEEKGKNTLAPGGVCTFKVDKKTAAENFNKWLGKRFFCPKIVKETAKAEKFQGLYLPYWTFDTDTVTKYTARYGKDRTRRKSDGSSEIVTDWYRTAGEYRQFIDDELINASTQHDRSLMAGLEPFNTADNVAYKPEYIAGFASERYSIGLKEGWEKAKSSIYNKLRSNIRSKIKRENRADRVDSLKTNTVYNNITYKYLLLPIWISSFRYGDKTYQFMVNGQTGKVSGRTPIDKAKVALVIGAGVLVLILFFFISEFL